MDSKNLLYKTLDLVIDDDIREFYKKALDNAPEEFWVVPSSSSGKNHPPENNIKGGLVIHTLKAVLCAFTLAEHEYFLLPVEEKNTNRDIVVVAAGCHDIKKGGEPWDKYCEKHGELAANYLDGFDLKDPEKALIKKAVYYHMKWLHKENAVALDLNRDPLVKIVQYADIVSSRKWASFFPGMPFCESKVELYTKLYLDRVLETLWQRKE